MSGAGKRPLIRRLALALAAVVIAAAIAAATLGADPGPARRASVLPAAAGSHAAGAGAASGPAPSACGPASAAAVASVDATVARGIYAGELRSREVSADVAHITGSQALLSALASGNEAAAYSAVHTIVYTPHWHIVRLRVVKGGRVLADVGGPDIIAPVSGTLRWHGRTVGTYVMSVQDDLGYVKLVSRFIGVPVDLYRNGSFLMGTLQPAPPSKLSTGATLTVAGNAYYDYAFNAGAFPSGALRVALLVPRPTGAVAATSCYSVQLATWGTIAMHIAARLHPLPAHYPELVDILRGATGGLAYVRSGSTRLAGGAGPARIPHQGIVKYVGRSWRVFSWEPAPPARVYVLMPQG